MHSNGPPCRDSEEEWVNPAECTAVSPSQAAKPWICLSPSSLLEDDGLTPFPLGFQDSLTFTQHWLCNNYSG